MANKPKILYTEDNEEMNKEIAKTIEIVLDADVSSFFENNDAARIINEGREFDAYIFDDNTPRSGGGSGTRLAVNVADKLRAEGKSGIVITACASNLAILGIAEGSTLFMSRAEKPLTLETLHENGVEFWFKFTERQTMIPWLADCLREKRVIPRDEWLTSVGENPQYQTEGRGSKTEQELFYYHDGLSKKDRGVYLTTDFAKLFAKLREGKEVREALKDSRRGEGIEKSFRRGKEKL